MVALVQRVRKLEKKVADRSQHGRTLKYRYALLPSINLLRRMIPNKITERKPDVQKRGLKEFSQVREPTGLAERCQGS